MTVFYENSGFLTNHLSREFSALIVFAEHRYFGESMPFGNQTEAYKKENNIYLTVEQALADYVKFLKHYLIEGNIFVLVYFSLSFSFFSLFLKVDCPDCPIIAFGGSYGGMLAAWLRMKFPNVVNAAIASSAPILYFKDVTPLNEFYKITTLNYKKSNITNCDKIIREAYQRLENYARNATQEKLTVKIIY